MDAAHAAREPLPHDPGANRPQRSTQGTSQPSRGLTEREQAILAFERQWWKYPGAKERAIRDLFDLSPTRYYQLLNALVERADALAADPMLVKRLRRTRATRQRARAARKLGFELR